MTTEPRDPIVTENTPQTVVESPVVNTPEPTPAPVVNEPTPASTPTEADGDKAPTVFPDWYQKRMNEMTGKRFEAERIATEEKARATAAEARAAEALAELARLKNPGATPASTPTPAVNPQLSEDEIEKRAITKAAQIAAATRFTEACNKIADDGQKEYKDFNEALKNLGMVGAIGDKAGTDFLETAVELREPHKVLHHLGMHPEEAAKIIAMPSKKMALEMARIEANLSKPATPAPVSNAPQPIIPVAGKGTPPIPSLDDPNTTAEDWFELRAKQIEERRNRYKR